MTLIPTGAVLCSITTIAGSALAAPIFEWDPDSIAFTGWEKREAQPWFPKPFGVSAMITLTALSNLSANANE